MARFIRSSWLLCVLSLALVACVGDECDTDSDCFSNSCTWGTCDSALLKGPGEPEEPVEPAKPPPKPTCRERVDCSWLLGWECAEQSACRKTGFCTNYEVCTFDNCPDCASRSEDACTGECTFVFLSCEPAVVCDGLSESACKARPGCTFQ